MTAKSGVPEEREEDDEARDDAPDDADQGDDGAAEPEPDCAPPSA